MEGKILVRNFLLLSLFGLSVMHLGYAGDQETRNKIQIDTLHAAISANQILFNAARGKHIVAFFGQTNSGKSTLINYLAGKPLTVNQFNDIVLSNPNDSLAMPIGIGAESETQYPKSIQVANTLLFDFPGLGDTRGLERDLVNAAYMKHLLQTAASIKIVFVCSQDEVTASRGAYVKDLIDTVYGLFPNKQVVEQSSLFVLTKNDQPSLEKTKEWLEKKCAPQYLEQLDGWFKSGRFLSTRKPINKQISLSERLPILETIRSCDGSSAKDIDISAVYSQADSAILHHLFFNLMSQHIQTKVPLKSETLTDVIAQLKMLKATTFMESVKTSLSKTPIAELLKPLCVQQYASTWQDFEKSCVPYLKDWIAYFEIKKNSLVEVEKKALNTHMNQLCVRFIDEKKAQLSLDDRYSGQSAAQRLLRRLQNFDRAQLQTEFLTSLHNDSFVRQKKADASTANIVSDCETEALNTGFAKALNSLANQVSQKINLLNAYIAEETRKEELRRHEEAQRMAECQRYEAAERRKQAEREQLETEERERIRQNRLQQETRMAQQERQRQREREDEIQRQRDEAEADRIALRLARGQEPWQQREAQEYHQRMQGLLRSGTTFCPTLGVPLLPGANFGVAAYPMRMGGNIVWYGF